MTVEHRTETDVPAGAPTTRDGRSPTTPPVVSGRREAAAPRVAGARLSAAAWESLFRAQVAVMRRLTQDDIWDEVNVREYDVLLQVAGAPGGCLRLRELNERILLSQPSLSRMVERLESRGLLVRDRAVDDARGVTVRLTETGAHVQRRVGRAHVQTIHRFVGGALDAEELVTLRDLCDRLLTAQGAVPHAASPPPAIPDLPILDPTTTRQEQ